jgi:hypothetical protein
MSGRLPVGCRPAGWLQCTPGGRHPPPGQFDRAAGRNLEGGRLPAVTGGCAFTGGSAGSSAVILARTEGASEAPRETSREWARSHTSRARPGWPRASNPSPRLASVIPSP